MSEYDRPEPIDNLVKVRHDTYRALKMLQLDNSSTVDMIVRDALKRRYPWLDL